MESDMAKLNRMVLKVAKNQLIDDAYQNEIVAAVARSPAFASLTWQGGPRREPISLPTPYGRLDVWANWRGTWEVHRSKEPLVQRGQHLGALFTSVEAAKAAGLLHVKADFGDSLGHNPTLEWKMPLKRSNVSQLKVSPADPSLSDDHEWGKQRLDRLLKEGDIGLADDENLIIDIYREARQWQLPMPPWIKRAHGWYDMATPYGTLTVRRLIGWTVERNGSPLVWNPPYNKRVIFDKLEHAKASALVHARDCGPGSYFDCTHFYVER
jgi:hypothetical protein